MHSVCNPVNPLCITCNGFLKWCSACSAGYGVGDFTFCQACTVSGCALCSTNKNTCTGCKLGYYFLSGTCPPCPIFQCSNCPTAGSCLSCYDFYGISAPNTCSSCVDPNCQKCSTNNGVCTQCKNIPNYGLLSNACQSCTVSYC